MSIAIPIKKLINDQIKKANSVVCVGLDPVISRLPACVKNSNTPVFEFNKSIIDATHDLVCAYKLQNAFYVGQRMEKQLEMTCDYLKKTYPHIPVILDAKRCDIGDVAAFYAQEAFDRYRADFVTVNPYMGGSTLKPFTDRKEKGTIVLCKTSNFDADDLQGIKSSEGIPLYLSVAYKAQNEWNDNDNVFLVVGATNPKDMAAIRKIAPDLPFLVPGVGAQGGNPKAVIENGIDQHGRGVIINSSRSIIYASSGDDFDKAAREATLKLQKITNEAIASALKERSFSE
jgi:orotidine-5'-phosphate decarboxylase